MIGWGLEALALYLILSGFGEVVPLGRSMFFYATSTLAGALIPVPGGLGVVEGMIREQLVRLSGVSEGTATGSMMLIRFATLWWSVLLGFAALACLRVKSGQARRRRRARRARSQVAARRNSSARTKSAGSGASKRSAAPVRGCVKPRQNACSA